MSQFLTSVQAALPDDASAAALAGRVWRPELAGPSIVAIRDGAVVDISATFPTMRDLCETADPQAALRAAKGEAIGGIDTLLANTPVETRDPGREQITEAGSQEHDQRCAHPAGRPRRP